ncbi:helix-turn-helix transcriptional regulator [Actinomadura hibisca]|uniref:helix-turn-helix transcriptional regulator n=1 Tax=Actinomadura hibisca TaxID=68565 RepID=UPI0014722F66|nr:LuxR family transcriptional regulator [Actinomadura hibisca]
MLTTPVPAAALRGRDREAAAITRLLERARAGQGGALTIAAAPGLGKTALLTTAAQPGFRVLATRGVRHESDVPYAGLHRLLHQWPTALARVLTPTGYVPFALCEALAKADRPLLCLVDDAHRLDRPSLEALAFAARRVSGLPVALLFTAGDPPPGYLSDLPRLALSPLDDQTCLHVLEDMAGQDLSADLVELAAGRPLALAELASCATPPQALPIHGDLRTRYRRRYLRLSPEARRLILLATAADRLPLEVHSGGLDEARASRLITLDGDTAIPDPLLRATVYADASPTERRAVHALLAARGPTADRPWHRAATTTTLDDALADDLATAAGNACDAGQHNKAARSWQRAAELTATPKTRADRLLTAASCAWTSGRPLRARALLRQAGSLGRADLLRGEIELADGLPVIAVWTLLNAADHLAATNPALALTALTRAGDAADAMGDVPCRIAVAERAAALGPRQDATEEFMAAHAIGTAAALQGNHEKATGPLNRALTLASTLDDSASRTAAAIAALMLGDDHRARDLAAQAVATARGHDMLEPRALTVLAHAEIALGRYPAALAAAHEGLRRATGQRNRAVEQHALIALVAALYGDAKTALSHLDGVLEEAGQRGLTRAAALASWALACLDIAADRPADAAARLGTPAGPAIRMLAAPLYVEAALSAGRRPSAIRVAAAFTRWAEATQSPARKAQAARCQALLAEDEHEATAHFTEAIRLHQDAGSAFELARTELLYGRRLRRDRHPRDARDHLRVALHVFTEAAAEHWAEQARTELRAAGAPVPPATGDPFIALTAQQQQIARLVAAGATNREIAARLTISPRTVDGHLRNVFTRLGIRSRVELARLLP